MRNIAILIFFALASTSCGSGLKLKKSQIKYFDSIFSAIVENKTFKQTGEGFRDSTFLNLFYIKAPYNDSIRINFNRDNELNVVYSDSGKINEKTFKGQFIKDGYYEFYFDNRKLDIPPIVPIFYSKHDIDRIRIYLTIGGDLVVDKMWDNSGSILVFLGAGDSRRQQSFFKIRKTQ